MTDGRWVAVPGGVLILDSERKVVGAIGISGDTSDKDEHCAIAAIQACGMHSEPAEPDAAWMSSSLGGAGH